MSHVPAVPEPAHVSRVPRTLLDRVAQWWRTSTLTLWAVTGAACLFQLMVLNVASYTYPHLPLRGWVIVALLLTASLVARRHWPLAVVIVTSLASGAVDLWGPRGGLNLLSMLALYALLVAASTRDRIIGFSISALCTLIPTALAKWPQVSTLSPGILILVSCSRWPRSPAHAGRPWNTGTPSWQHSPPNIGWSPSATPPATRPGWPLSSTTPWATP